MINKEEIKDNKIRIDFFMAYPKGELPKVDGSIPWGCYNNSWEWLMPVVDKINSLGKEYSFAIFKNYVSLTVEKGGKVYKDFSFAYSEYITAEQTGKEATYKLILKFIKWYEENIINNLEKTTDGHSIR